MAKPDGAEQGVDTGVVRGLLLLTMTAGMIDAVTFLGLGEVFAANMTGNLVVLGLAIAGAPTLSIDGPAVALAAFLAGAALIGRVERHDQPRRYYVLHLVRIEVAVIAVATALAIGFDGDEQFRRLVIIAVLAGLMGVRNETIRRINVPELRTTVLTLAIAGFAAHEAEGAHNQWGDRLRFAGIVAMIAGAIISALLVLNTEVVWALAAITLVEGLTLLVLVRGGSAPTGAGDTVRA